MRTAGLTLSFLVFVTLLFAGGAPADKDLAKKPVTNAAGLTGNLLRQWWKDGSAAGHVGDWYDNRDRGHSDLDPNLFPQLRRVVYSKEDVEARRDFGLQPLVRPQVVFGNSSTSSQPEAGGSNMRTFYVSQQGLDILQKQYLKNNLYVYPEHRDHDPGRNGVGDGFGDVYPTNTPYLITSQGSSGSDGVFLQVAGYALASLRPEVKKKLIESGTLMPTVQMLLRSSNNQVRTMADYYLGKAHPTVFDGVTVDLEKLMRRARDLRVTTIPPLVKLHVVSETKTEVGRDFFEPLGRTEQHSDTVSVIARIWRGHQRTRTMVVSAEKSVDVNNYPLTFRWEVLRGDEKRVQIKPKNKAGSVVEITVAYHERRPIAPGSAMESNRVDVGVFANNGVYPSAPGFVTFFSLDSEARHYDNAGRIVEIGYGMGFTELQIGELGKVVAALSRDELPAKVLGVTAEQRADLERFVKQEAPLRQEVQDRRQKREVAQGKFDAASIAYRNAETMLDERRKEKKEIANEKKAVVEAKAQLAAAQKELDAEGKSFAAAEQAYAKAVEAARKPLGASVQAYVRRVLEGAMRTPTLWNVHRAALTERLGKAEFAEARGRLDVGWTKLVQLGVVREGEKRGMELEPRLTAYQRAMLEEYHGRVLADVVLPGLVTATFRPNFVDLRLTTTKAWRDVYEYEGGELKGWKRYLHGEKERMVEFTPEGWVVTAKDAMGRVTQARTIQYGQLNLTAPAWANTNPLVHIWGDEVITFTYEGTKRIIKSRGKLKDV